MNDFFGQEQMEEIRSLPNSRKAEEAVIGSVLIDPNSFTEISQILEEQHFYIIRNRWIWETFSALTAKHEPIDLLTVISELENQGRLEEIGGQAYLMELVNRTPTSQNVRAYADMVFETYMRRKLLMVAGEMAKIAYDEKTDLNEKIPLFMTNLLSTIKVESGAEHVSKVLSELYSEIKARSEDPKDIWGIATGFYEFDILTGGQHKGELTLLSGKPGLGKSIVCMQMAIGMARQCPGAVYEMEMGRTQTIRRELANLSRVQTRRMRSGNLMDGDWEKIMSAIEQLEKLPVYISDYTGWTTASMRADLARLKALYKIEWFMVDYLYLLNDKGGNDDWERLSQISKALKNICKDLDLSGLVISSMTKAEMESHNPSMAAMRGSAQIAHDADVILYIVEDEINKSNIKLQFAKFREDTPKQSVKLKRDDGFPGFKADVNNEITYSYPYKE